MTEQRKPELRLYSFVNNIYMSAIQHGIQTGHAAVRLVRQYTDPDCDIQIFADAWYERSAMVNEWADNWETFIILGAGDYQGVNEAYDILFNTDFPIGDFKESARANGGLRTCAVAVLPDYIFNAQFDYQRSKNLPKDTPVYSWIDLADAGKTEYVYKPGDKHYELVSLLRRSRLA
jgi:hypothetical protein